MTAGDGGLDACDRSVAGFLGCLEPAPRDGEVLLELAAESLLDVERGLVAACLELGGLPCIAQLRELRVELGALGARSLLGPVGAVDGVLRAPFGLPGAPLHRLRFACVTGAEHHAG